ncbi:MAG TPA: dockerin type I repeat-containing protein [Tepidisphaeraceae bacterium]|jgi:hypothetical protein|nr:dockerin type I repeat-containing protein [Tepidisphaeraceae bacterium]
MPLILDVRPANSTQSAIVAPGATVSLDVYARITGAATGSLQDIFYGINNSGGTPLGALSTVQAVSPFNGYWQGGTLANGSVGLGSASSSDGWVFAHSLAMTAGTEMEIGVLTFTAGNTFGTTTLTIVPSTRDTAAFWMADGVYQFDPAIAGQSLTITVARPGDANLDGRINADDYALIDRGMAKHLTGWSNGDFNGDGVVNAADYRMIDLTDGGGITSPSIAIPEPLLCPVISAGYLLRRRRA